MDLKSLKWEGLIVGKKLVLRFLILLAAAIIWACSGGGGNDGNDDGGGTNYVDIPVSDADRAMVLDSLASTFNALQDTDLSEDDRNLQMKAYLESLPQIEAAGVSADGSVWGRFTDDRLILFAGPREPNPIEETDMTAMLSPPSEVPGGSESRVTDILGVRYGEAYTPITEWLQQAGYGASLPGNFTVMTSMGSLGLLVISSHGGTGQWRDNTTAYAIWGDAFDIAPNKDEEYRFELADHRLCYMYADSGYDLNKSTNQWRYAFTAKYVLEYLNFDEGSLVFMDACSSNEPVMRSAFLAKGASVYAGWSAPVDSYNAKIAASYLFDRLLGANTYDAENPKQRPFDWPSVFAWMQDNGYDIGQDAGGCYLMMTAANEGDTEFGVLAPSIQFIFAHPYDEELYLYGLFGKDPGSNGQITVGGSQLAVKEWARDGQTELDKIVCTLPFDGAGSSGDVQVTIRNHKSNIRRLSLYKGDIKFTYDAGDGRKFDITHHLRFRVDLLDYRTEPHEAAVYLEPQYIHADDISDAEYEASGETLLPDETRIVWQGNGDMANNINGQSSDKGFIATIRFDPETQSARIMLSGVIHNGISQVIYPENGPPTTLPMTVLYGNDTFDGKEDNWPSYVEVNLNAGDFDLPEVERKATNISMDYLAVTPGASSVTISLDPITCQSPPDTGDAR